MESKEGLDGRVQPQEHVAPQAFAPFSELMAESDRMVLATTLEIQKIQAEAKAKMEQMVLEAQLRAPAPSTEEASRAFQMQMLEAQQKHALDLAQLLHRNQSAIEARRERLSAPPTSAKVGAVFDGVTRGAQAYSALRSLFGKRR